MKEQIPNAENDERIANMLSDLKRVEAPENFEFGVKARIARGEPKESRNLFPILKVAIPAAALGLLAIIFYTAGYQSSEIRPVVVQESPNRTNERVADPDLAKDAMAPGESEQKNEVASRPNNSNVKNPAGSVDLPSTAPDGVGSIDKANPQPPKEIRPKGFSDDPERPGQKEYPQKAIPVQNILQMVGISAEFRGGRYVANGVTEKSPAERAGVKSGDVIEAMNDVPITPSTEFKGGIELKSIRVNRAGRSIKLEKFN